MNRANPYRIFLVLAVMVAGTLCLFLPEKKSMPVTNVQGTKDKDKVDSVQSDSSMLPMCISVEQD